MAHRDIPPPSPDDFASLVSRSNPAARQYQGGSSNQAYAPAATYPPPQTALTPRSGGAQPMDPFFDDEDEDDANPFGDGRGNPFTDKHAASSSLGPGGGGTGGYGMSTPSLGLTANAAAPAGVGASTSTVALGKDGMPPGWAFDDDEPVNQPAGSTSRSVGGSGGLKGAMKKRGGGWKWPWTKEQVLEGERTVWLNDQARNISEGYPNNYVSTSKYNVVTFVPKFFAGTSMSFFTCSALIWIGCRAILEICKRVLLVHCTYSTSAGCQSDESVHNDCAVVACLACECLQGSIGRFGEH